MGDNMIKILVSSMLIESIWETIKIIIKSIKEKQYMDSISYLGAILISILICLNYKLDLLLIMGYTDHIPYLGNILTAILVSRGSNFVHDMWNKLGGIQTKKNSVK